VSKVTLFALIAEIKPNKKKNEKRINLKFSVKLGKYAIENIR